MDQRDDAMNPETSHRNGKADMGMPAASRGDADAAATEHSTEGVGAGLRPGFLAELATAMRATAEKERERIAERVSEDASAHVEKVRARAAIETDELKRLAEEDVQHIEEWAAGEMERIRSEADRKVEDRRASLEEYLQQHDSIIDTEIEGVNGAVAEYDRTLDRFFEDLSHAEDPATIVARAEALPAPPDLDQVRAAARARAVAMFADQDEPAATAEPAVAEAAAIDATASAEPMSEPEAPLQPMATTDVAGTAETGEPAGMTGLIGDTIEETTPVAEATTEAPEMTAAAAPVPVMDPAATSDPSWPAPMPETPVAETTAAEPQTSEPEPEPVAAAAEHTSAAVRLLRSVAPWTAPTHSGSDDRSDTD